jgi:hypothetical protein
LSISTDRELKKCKSCIFTGVDRCAISFDRGGQAALGWANRK